MNVLKKIPLLFLLLLFHFFAIAQLNDKTEVKEVYLSINYVYRVHDTVIAFLQNARSLGIENKSFVRAFQSYKSATDGVSAARSMSEIGSGTIMLYDTLVSSVIKLYHEADSLEIGDLVSLKLKIPVLPYRSVFSDLAFANILYTNADRKPLYHLQDIINRDNKNLEDSIYAVIISDLKATYERVKNWTNLPESLRKRLEGGRFQGRIPLEILRDVTRKDLESFFLYVKTYPASYMSNEFRASESFAGWLVSNSPYSVPEIKNALFPIYKNLATFNKELPKYKADILREGTAKSIGEEAIGLSNSNRFKEAHELADFAIALANAVKDTSSKPAVHLYKAQIYQDQEKYAEAILECDKAISEAIVAKDRNMEMQIIIKKGFCFYKISKYREAEKIFTDAAKKLSGYKELLDASQYKENIRKIYEYQSDIKYQSGQYDAALRLLDTAILINNQINSYDANIRNAGFYKFIGRVYNDQGKPGDALIAFEKSKTIYKDNSDVLNRAIVENDVAYSYYNLGEYRKSILSCEWAFEKLIEEGDFNNAGYSKSLMGSCYWELGKYDSAVASHKISIEFRKKSNSLPGQAKSWKSIGDLYQLSGSKIAALQALDSAAFIYQKIKDSSGMAQVYNKKGEVFLNDENYRRAAEWFEKANGVNSKSTIEALYQLGSAWYAIDTIKARKYFESAREKSQKDGNINYQFFSAKSLAMLAYKSHNFSEGENYYKECLSLSEQMKTAASWASCLNLNAYRFETRAELDSALEYYKNAFAIYDSVDKSNAITQLSSIANVYISKGEFQKADEAYAEAALIARNIKDSLALGSILQSTSFLYSLTAEFEKGLTNNDKALTIFKKSGNMIRLSNTYGSRGTILSSMGDYKNSVLSYLTADSIYKDELLEDQRGIVYNNIGVVYIGQSDYETALKYLDKSLATMKKGVIDEGYLLTKGNIAECLLGLKKTNEAKKLLLEILPQARKMKLERIASGMSLLLGKIFFDEVNLKQANEYYTYALNSSLASGEKEKSIDALVYLGKIFVAEKKYDSAKVNFQKSVSLADQYKTTGSWNAYYELGLFYYDQQQFDSAVIKFKQAVGLLEKNTENLYGGEEAKKIFNNDPRKADLYNKITFSYYNIGNIKEAWAYANRSNIAGIKELSGTLSVNSTDEERNAALKKLLAMQQSRKALENNLEKQSGTAKEETLKKIEILEADYNNFLQDVVEQYPELSTYFSRSNADEFNNYKGKLDDDVAVALYLVNGNTLMIFTLTNEKLAVDTMTLDITPRITTFIETIKNTSRQTGTGPLSERSDPQDEEKVNTNVEFKDISNELYKALIATVYDKIGAKKKLCIIPTGIFSNMPFQCLGRKMPDRSFRFLIEDHCVFYTNKMSVFNTVAKNDLTNNDLKSFAAFGVPDATLRYNISEVQNIGKIMGSDSTIYTDYRATESMAKQSLRNKKFIHFATHGVLNYSSDYSESYLKLLPDKDTSNGNNGKLTMREVQKLGITDCNMVILSACQTAVAKQLVKGWNISPANSFLVSHVKTVVASLWKVADEPTGILMEYFYDNLNKSMGKADALRMAQIKLSQDPRFRHPNYWGAFVLYGEWK